MRGLTAWCVVTRYFGGVLLGTGGLVRAPTPSQPRRVSMPRSWCGALRGFAYPA